MTTRGETHERPLWALRIKCWSIFSVTSKSAMTPSFIGRMATMLPGVRPSISLASLPTASTLLVILLIATMDGSLTTMPRPLAYTSVLAVPRSMARSLEKGLNKFLILVYVFQLSPNVLDALGAGREAAVFRLCSDRGLRRKPVAQRASRREALAQPVATHL